MASIKGVTVKGIKTFRGHEGEPLSQGNIYIDNKKAGFYSDGDWGGNPTIMFDTKEFAEKFDVRMKEYFAEKPNDYETDEFFFCDLLESIELEKVFKKRLKERYPITARFDFRGRVLSMEDRIKPHKQSQVWSFGNEAQLEKTLAEEKPVVATIIRQLSDLVI